MKISSLVFFVLWGLTLFAPGSALCDELVEGKDFVCVTHDGGAGGYEAFPDVARLKDGRLFCVFYDGYSHVAWPNEQLPNGGRISGCFSEDEGKTWSDPFVVFDSPFDDRDASVTVTEDGTILVNFFLLDFPVRPNTWLRKLGAWFIKSSDGGQTWSHIYPICDTFFVSSPIRILSDGRWVVGVYNEDAPGALIGLHDEKDAAYQAGVCISDDQGATWKTVVIPTGELLVDAETDVIELANGNLLALLRHREGERPMALSRSTDRGETWSVCESTGFSGHCPYLYKAPDGTLLLGTRTAPEGRTIPGENIVFSTTTLRTSTDDGKTWNTPITVDPNFWGAYPSMVNLKDGSTLFIYYEEGDGSNIRARKFRADKGSIQWETF